MSTDAYSYATENKTTQSYDNYTCKSCRYFHIRYQSDNKTRCTYGSCHRYPPKNFIIDKDIKTIFPMLPIDTFACGEFGRTFMETDRFDK